MNKFIVALAFVAVVGGVAYGAPNGKGSFFKPTPEAELENLKPEYAKYKDFCLETSTEVNTWLNNKAAAQASAAFQIVQEAVADSANSIGARASEAAEAGSVQITADARFLPEVLNKIAHDIMSAGGEQASDIIERAKQGLSRDTFIRGIQKACQAINQDLKDLIEKQFEDAKKKLSKSAANAEEKAALSSAKMNKLGCLTTRRLNKVTNGCDMVMALMPFVKQYLEN